MTTVRWPASLRELDLFAECSDDELRTADALMTRTEIRPAGPSSGRATSAARRSSSPTAWRG